MLAALAMIIGTGNSLCRDHSNDQAEGSPTMGLPAQTAGAMTGEGTAYDSTAPCDGTCRSTQGDVGRNRPDFVARSSHETHQLWQLWCTHVDLAPVVSGSSTSVRQKWKEATKQVAPETELLSRCVPENS